MTGAAPGLPPHGPARSSSLLLFLASPPSSARALPRSSPAAADARAPRRPRLHPRAMSQYAESSSGVRARSRAQVAHSSAARSSRMPAWDPVGELSGFPLMVCPKCGLARVVEGRSQKENENHGRLYFKCARNAYPKQCKYYRFEKEYFTDLKERGIIVVRPANWADRQDLMEQQVEEPSVDSPNGHKKARELEQKIDSLIWRVTIVVACVVCFVLGSVFMNSFRK